MILTDRFVYLHQPKTGGTFVTRVLQRIHGSARPRKRLSWSHGHVHDGEYGRLLYLGGRLRKHATRRWIPLSHSRKPILATVRSPYELYVSQYLFEWWKRPEYVAYLRKAQGLREAYPEFPDLRFDRFLAFVNEPGFPTFPLEQLLAFSSPTAFRLYRSRNRRFWATRGDWKKAGGLGRQSEQFIRFYCRAAGRALRNLLSNGASVDRIRFEVRGVRFMRTHALNKDLFDSLLEFGYDPTDIEFVRQLQPIRPKGGGRNGQQWQHYYTDRTKRKVREKESLLFDLFPQFDI